MLRKALDQGIKSFKVTPTYMRTAATPTSCVIHYGGKTGSGKRIDMEITTATYVLKLNIRDTQGGDGWGKARMYCRSLPLLRPAHRYTKGYVSPLANVRAANSKQNRTKR